MIFTPKKTCFIICAIILCLAIGAVVYSTRGANKNSVVQNLLIHRPSEDQYLYDYVGVIDSQHTYDAWQRYLKQFQDEFGFEVVVLIVPSLEGRNILETTSSIFSAWNIGGRFDGRGLLLLLSCEEKIVKIEVSYELEDIFTDYYCGWVEERDLKRHLEQNRIEAGIGATLEMFMMRADGRLNDDDIRKMVTGSLSGGGGIVENVDIASYPQKSLLSASDRQRFCAQKTPEQTFKKLVDLFREEVEDFNIELYTIETQSYIKRLPKYSEQLCEYWVRKYTDNTPVFEVKGDYAVVLFPSDRKMGPLFFKKSHNGWQFDIVSWASWVRFTFNGEAYVMGDDHPYVFAFENTEYSYMLADYDYCDDYSYFSDIQDNYEEHFGKMINQISHDPGDVETRIELGKLYFDLRIVPYATSILLEARELNPDKPIVHLLLGLLMRDFYMLPLKAVDYFKKYIKLRPNDGRGYLYLSKSYWRQAAVDIAYYEKAAKTILRYGEITGDRIYSYERAGYYYYCAKKYREARKYFELVLQMEPANEYVKMKLTEINRRN